MHAIQQIAVTQAELLQLAERLEADAQRDLGQRLRRWAYVLETAQLDLLATLYSLRAGLDDLSSDIRALRQ